MGQRFDWNVVVLGGWNKAILTPAGIKKRLFKEEGMLEVQVPIDGLGPYRAKVGPIGVIVDSQSLEVSALKCTYENLLGAMKIAQAALIWLPETPLSAIGINIRYKFDSLPSETADRLRCEFDSQLAELEYVRVENGVTKSVEFNDGVINAIVSSDKTGKGTLVVNFTRTTQEQAEAIKWLELPIEELRKHAQAIAVAALAIPESELNNEN